MRVVVHWINAPLISGAVMRGMKNAIHYRIAHIEIWRRHVDLRAQHTAAVWKLAIFHAHKKIEILFNGSISKRTVLAGLGQSAAIPANFIRGQVVDIRLSILDEFQRPLEELREI